MERHVFPEYGQKEHVVLHVYAYLILLDVSRHLGGLEVTLEFLQLQNIFLQPLDVEESVFEPTLELFSLSVKQLTLMGSKSVLDSSYLFIFSSSILI